MKVVVFAFACLFLGVNSYNIVREDGPECRAPNGGGLEPVLKEFTALIPMEEVLTVLLTHMTSDPETQAVMEFLSSPDFHQIVHFVQSQAAFTSLVKFACNELYLDAAYYFNLLSGIFGFGEVRAPRVQHVNVAQRSVVGLIHEILDLLPVEEMRALLDSKLATDYYLQVAFQKINSDEFGTLVETLQGNVAYGDMKNRLRGLGVDVDYILETVNKIFH